MERGNDSVMMEYEQKYKVKKWWTGVKFSFLCRPWRALYGKRCHFCLLRNYTAILDKTGTVDEEVETKRRRYFGLDDNDRRKKGGILVLNSTQFLDEIEHHECQDIWDDNDSRGGEGGFEIIHDELIVYIFRLVGDIYHVAQNMMSCRRLNTLLHSCHKVANPTIDAAVSAESGKYQGKIHDKIYIDFGELLWRDAMMSSLQFLGKNYIFMLHNKYYGSSWKKMFLDYPRLRNDGLYISRNT